MPDIAVVQSWNASAVANDSQATLSGVTAGNLLVGVMMIFGTQTPSISDNGSGTAWTHVGTAGTGSPRTLVFLKIAEGDPTTVTFTSSGGNLTYGYVYEVVNFVTDLGAIVAGFETGTTSPADTSHATGTPVAPAQKVLMIGGTATGGATWSLTPSTEGYTMLTTSDRTISGHRTADSGFSSSFGSVTADNEVSATALVALKEVAAGGSSVLLRRMMAEGLFVGSAH